VRKINTEPIFKKQLSWHRRKCVDVWFNGNVWTKTTSSQRIKTVNRL